MKRVVLSVEHLNTILSAVLDQASAQAALQSERCENYDSSLNGRVILDMFVNTPRIWNFIVHRFLIELLRITLSWRRRSLSRALWRPHFSRVRMQLRPRVLLPKICFESLTRSSRGVSGTSAGLRPCSYQGGWNSARVYLSTPILWSHRRVKSRKRSPKLWLKGLKQAWGLPEFGAGNNYTNSSSLNGMVNASGGVKTSD